MLDDLTSKGEQSRAQIIAATTGLICDRGFSSLTLQEILDAARVTKGKFFHHFNSKEELFRQTLVDALESRKFFRFEEVLSSHEDLSAYQRLMLLLGSLIEWHRKGLPTSMRLCVLATLFFSPASKEMAQIRKLLQSNLEQLRKLLVASKAVGDLPSDFDVESVTYMLPSLTIGGNIVESLADEAGLPANNLMVIKQFLENSHRLAQLENS